MTIAITPIPAQIVYVAPSLTLTTANATGSALSAIRSDADVLAYDTTVPVTQAFGDAASSGGATATAARRSHVHGMPSDADVVAVAEADTTFEHAGGMSLSGATAVASGIEFPSTESAQASVNNLDDYREGVWTPGLADSTGDGSGESQVYGVQVGRYTKIGNRVLFNGRMTVVSIGTLTGSDAASIVGLPFTSNATSSNFSVVSIGGAEGLAIAAGVTMNGQVSNNVTRIDLRLWDVVTGESNMTIAEVSAGAELVFSGSYEV